MSTQPFTYSRVLDAPRKLVYLVNIDPAHLMHWMGPAGAKMIKSDMDLRPGGVHHYGLRMPDGLEMWGKQIYKEIVPFEKIVLVQCFSDAQGGITRHPMAPTWPAQTLATTTFEDAGPGKTKVTVSWLPYEATPEEVATFDAGRAGMDGGFGGMMDNLDRHLKNTETQLIHSRLIPASRERIWQALVDPAQVNKWWGPQGFKNEVESQEVRVGGVWKFTMVGPDGTRYPNRSVYQEIKAPERLAYEHGSWEHKLFDALVELTEEGGKTRVTMTLRTDSRQARDGFTAFAIEGGWQHLAKLEAFVAGKGA
jgi:uncharacterized protein YndB with AHSA1/START domain